MSVAELPRTPGKRRLNCDNCHRTRFYVYRSAGGRLILVCYSCGTPQDTDQQQ